MGYREIPHTERQRGDTSMLGNPASAEPYVVHKQRVDP
jgi:hypothetical protein